MKNCRPIALLLFSILLLFAPMAYADVVIGGGVPNPTELTCHITHVTVSASSTSVSVGSSLSCTATATYSNGTSQDVTSRCSWSSSDPSVISGNGPGFSAAGPGYAEISAMVWEPNSGTATGSTQIHVYQSGPAPGQVHFKISPGSYAVRVGDQVQFRAMLTRSGTQYPENDVTSSSNWSIDNSNAVKVGNGQFMGSKAGTSIVYVSYYDTITQRYFNDEAELTILPPVRPAATLVVSPASLTGYVGDVRQYSAFLRYSDGSTADVTSTCDWRSRDGSVAYSLGNGRFKAQASGSTTITAVLYQNGVAYTDTADFRVYSEDSLYISPSTATVNAGSPARFTAYLHHRDGRPDENVTALCTWSVSNTGASVTGKGEIIGVSKGQTSVYAVFKGGTTLTATADLTVHDRIQPVSHRYIVFQVGSYTYTVDGASRSMEVAPFISDGRTFVPQGYLGYAMGMEGNNIIWDSARQNVTFQNNGNTVVMTLGSVIYYVNGVQRTMDVPLVMRNNRLFCPVAYVAQAFGYQVSFNPATQSVTVSR